MNITREKASGFTLIELIIATAVLGILVSIAYPSYLAYKEKVDNAIAITELQNLISKIEIYNALHNGFPESLNQLNLSNDQLNDPWGNPYSYLNLSTVRGNGQVRKDRNLKPINGAYDLYSKGKNGTSVSPINATPSQDDIIVANDGSYIGLASEY